MTAVQPTPAPATALSPEMDEERRDALAERLFLALIAGTELLSIELGRRLGLYATLADAGPLDPPGLAAAAGIAPRYAREWLEQQAVAGFLDVVAAPRADVGGDDAADGRRYALPASSAAVLLDGESPAHLLGAAPCLTGLALTLDEVADAYRSGGGVAYADFGTEIRQGIGAFNRPVFANELPGWLDALPDVRDRLADGGRVLDLGCGIGWSTIALARALPAASVVGVDLDADSIADARANADAAGVDVELVVADGAGLLVDGPGERSEPIGSYDLVTVFEALHDMGEPVEALRRARALLAPGGAVLVADERVGATFTAPGDDIERLNYGWSALHCLPATMHESATFANGTVLREPTVRDWAARAGFADVEVLPVENDFWRFYRLRP